jgi:hypothetical protein
VSLPRIVVEFVYPPIPIRQFDYLAYYADEADEQMDHGTGRTAAEAVVDLLENHPRGVWCCDKRRCDDCVYFGEITEPATWTDPAYGSPYCNFHHRRLFEHLGCYDHTFEGEREMWARPTLPPEPRKQEEEIVF